MSQVVTVRLDLEGRRRKRLRRIVKGGGNPVLAKERVGEEQKSFGGEKRGLSDSGFLDRQGHSYGTLTSYGRQREFGKEATESASSWVFPTSLSRAIYGSKSLCPTATGSVGRGGLKERKTNGRQAGCCPGKFCQDHNFWRGESDQLSRSHKPPIARESSAHPFILTRMIDSHLSHSWLFRSRLGKIRRPSERKVCQDFSVRNDVTLTPGVCKLNVPGISETLLDRSMRK